MFALKVEELPHYTYDDYRNWEGEWELIGGVPYNMAPAPVISHQRISKRIVALLDEALQNCPGCEALPAVDWKVNEETVVQPDVSLVCFPANGAHITQAPAVIFEILSPSTAAKDRGVKYRLYEREGVRYYVLVDGEEETLQVFELVDGVFRELVVVDTLELMLEQCNIEISQELLFKR